MSDEEQLTRTSLADLRSKFEGLVELAEERRARDDHKPRKSTSVPTPSHSGPSSTATSRISRSPSLAPVPRIQIHTSADDMSAISSDPRKDVEAATVSPGGQRVESASRPPPPVPSHSGCNTRSAISPIVLSPSLSIPGNQNPSAIESNNDEGSVEAPPSVASLRSRFDTGIKQNLGTPSALGVKLSPTLRMPSRPVSPDMATASRSNPFDTVARYRASSPLETTPSTSPNRQQLEANEEPVGLSVHTSSPSPVSKPSSKPPPPPIPPKSWNTSSATSEKSTPPSELPIASGSGLSPVPIPPRPITTRMGSATNLLTASPANIPPPLPGRTPTPGTEDTMLPKLPGRAKGAPVTGTTSAHPSHPGLPPRRTSNAAFRSEETLLPTRAQNPPVSTAHTHDTSTDDYQPPPPPQRKTTHNPSPRLQSRVNKSNSQDQNPSDPEDEEDEDGEPQGPKRTMSAFARRALDEYPDSSRAHRRAPDFVPRQYVTGNTQHHVHAFAVCGHTLCLASHHLRVYDLRLGDAYPTFTFDPKSADLEFRGGGAKITAVSFRALSPGTEEGRYVWCGTNEGHLIEVDTSTGKPTCARADVHGTPITHIFRYNEYMLSLEENGKMHIFGPFGESAKSDASRLMSPSGTIRIAEKQNFARMLGSQLWTASGPATRSATDPSLPGPTIRVYEPLGNGTLNNGSGTTHTSEWTGAVTAAAVLSSNPSLVYLAHEGGYVSIFDRDSLDCLSVIKISSSDVLALEGVGDRLWAGYRTGMIQVYDPSTKPWTTTNTWLAHP
ncbi:hypothetical protein QFC19_008261 [Naganishia cerealis]|uniref:Uncharacterized protein n=1 Tax=Naganishia cerealis TaxID=610337 RepID=A0ACC2V2M0_9TREE|nr:hypothetical protein QFC19_008261 [Naganishia cerealis]